MSTKKITLMALLMSLSISLLSFSFFGGSPNKPIDPTQFNASIKPGDDFFEYVNSNWIKSNPIPKERSKWGTFYILDDSSQAAIKRICMTDAAMKSPAGSSAQKVGDFFASGMDSTAREKEGYKSIQPYLDMVDGIKNTDDLIRVVAETHKLNGDAMFNLSVGADPKASGDNIVQLNQSGIGLPSRDFYFSKQLEAVRVEYKKHIGNLLKLIGYKDQDASDAVTATYNLENTLANFSKDNVALRDPYANYNKMTYAQLKSSMPDFNWDLYVKTLGMPSVNNVVVGQPVFFDALNKLVKNTPINDWKHYLRFHIVADAAGYLSKDFEQESFNFNDRVLNGTQVMRPRWRRVLGSENYCLGELLGQEYVKAKFTADAKKKAQDLIKNLMTSLSNRINNLDWMSPATKSKALAKLNAITVKVGYPDKWKDYSTLTISRVSYATNVQNSIKLEFDRTMAKVNKPVDRGEWEMTPQTVNAYYEPSNNEIVFPAAILQPPFFDANADNAVNYGGIGVVIGHELTHGFDDQGRLYDGSGNLNNWWTADDSTKYTQKTNQIVKEYGAYCPLDSVCINGNLTLGENIADNGGILISYYAFEAENKKSPQPALIDGLSPEQRFFVSFAIIWRGSYTDKSLRQQLMTNPHSPGKYRVLGTCSNLPEFYAAFHVKEGDKMWRPDNERARIW